MEISTSAPANEDKGNIEIIRKQEYLSQMKKEVKFPIFEIFKKYTDLKNDQDFKHHTKIKILKKKVNEDDDDEEEPLFSFIFVFNDRIILTKDTIENISESSNNNPIMNMIEYNKICIYKLIVNDDTVKNEMYIQYYNNDYSKKEDLNFQFVFHKDSFCIHHFIKKYYILKWQEIFESTILKDLKNLIYNRHFILIKYNRWGAKQERTLLITNFLILNIKHNFQKERVIFNPKNIQWADSIKAIQKIVVVKNQEKQLKVYMNKIVNQAEIILHTNDTKYVKYKECREYEFFSTDERNEFIAIMRKNYFDINKEYLKMEYEETKA